MESIKIAFRHENILICMCHVKSITEIIVKARLE